MPEKSSSGELARRLELRSASSRSWVAILQHTDSEEERQSFAEDLSVLLSEPLRQLEIEVLLKEGHLEALKHPADDLVLLYSSTRIDCQMWRSLDLKRSLMERPGLLLFWLREREADLLADCAPNIKSYLGASIFGNDTTVEYMDESEEVHRLEQLRAHFKRSDASTIALAEQGTLEGTPSNTEWLILLGRSDLVRDSK